MRGGDREHPQDHVQAGAKRAHPDPIHTAAETPTPAVGLTDDDLIAFSEGAGGKGETKTSHTQQTYEHMHTHGPNIHFIQPRCNPSHARTGHL